MQINETMSVLGILDNTPLIIFSALIGAAATWIFGLVSNRRGVFSYHVTHNQVGMSADDSIFGNVSVTWNNHPVQHLFLSTVELKNESLNDYKNIVLTTYTNDTLLLTESTHILGTPNILELTENYRNKIRTESGQQPNDEQINFYHGQREHLIPVFNRGQVVKISYLNASMSGNTPNLWLSVTAKGVQVKFCTPQIQIFGVSQLKAALAGIVLGILGLYPLVTLVQHVWVAATIALFYGFLALFPGVCVIRIVRKIREGLGG